MFGGALYSGRRFSDLIYSFRFAMADLPLDDAGLDEWVKQTFKEKDSILQQIKDEA